MDLEPEYRMKRVYQGKVKAVIFDWAGEPCAAVNKGEPIPLSFV